MIKDNPILHERVATLEANGVSMNKSIDALATSVTELNKTVNNLSARFATAMGGFAVLVFLGELLSSYLRK